MRRAAYQRIFTHNRSADALSRQVLDLCNTRELRIIGLMTLPTG